MISTGLAKELGLKLNPTDVLLKNVQGEMVKAEGEAKVELRIGEQNFIDSVIVIKDSNDMLLGFSHLSFAKIIKNKWLSQNKKEDEHVYGIS